MTQSAAAQLPLLWRDEPNANGLKDPTHSGNKGLSLHRWVNWIAGFSAQFVNSVIDRYLSASCPGRATVLDPFAGVGTTNVEALRRGFDTYGFELNPFPALAARCKLDVAHLDLTLFEESIKQYAAFISPHEKVIDQWCSPGQASRGPYAGPMPVARPPHLFRSRHPFFSPPVELKVLFTLDFINAVESPMIRQYFWLAFGSTMVSYSNYSYEPSLSSRVNLGKSLVENASVSTIMVDKLRQMVRDARELRADLEQLSRMPQGHIFTKSFFQALDDLEPGSIDLAITSPPYVNNYHYVRNTRPQLYWLGFVQSPKEAARFETQSFGKFWQTVREGPPVELRFPSPSLQAKLVDLAALHPDKGIYGGTGWANYAASYFNDSHRFFGIMRDLLKPGGHAVIVVGNSLLQGMEFRVDEILAELASSQGLTADVERIRSKRVGDSIVGTGLRQKPQNGRPELYEAAVVVTRPVS